MFELSEHHSGGNDVSDPRRAGSDALQGPPATGEQGEAAFAQCAQAALERGFLYLGDGIANLGLLVLPIPPIPVTACTTARPRLRSRNEVTYPPTRPIV